MALSYSLEILTRMFFLKSTMHYLFDILCLLVVNSLWRAVRQTMYDWQTARKYPEE